MDLGGAADELYGLSPAQFIMRRDALVTEAKKAGDKELAADLKKLRRPTKGAWLANILVRERPEQVRELLELGEEMRTAQDQLAGDELRQLSRRRQQLVSALAGEAWGLAEGAGEEASVPAINELTSTLEAAVADRAASEALASGRLAVALSYSGFGSFDAGAAVGLAPTSGTPAAAGTGKGEAAAPEAAAAAGAPTGQREPAAAPPGVDLGKAEQTVAEAESDAAEARHELEDASMRLQVASQESARLINRIVEIESELSWARSAAAAADEESRAARRARTEAERRLRAAEDRASRARRELDQLSAPTRR